MCCTSSSISACYEMNDSCKTELVLNLMSAVWSTCRCERHKKSKSVPESEMGVCGQRSTPLLTYNMYANIKKNLSEAVSVDHSVFLTDSEFIKDGRHKERWG